MTLPFTTSEFLGVFRQYNDEVWPAQWLLLALAIGAVIAALRPQRHSGRAIAGVLALLWFWMGVVYHVGYFAEINEGAFLFAAVFVGQATLFAVAAVRDVLPAPGPRGDRDFIAGTALVAYALIGYPLVSLAAGHSFPAMPTFGVPCPTTIFTLGVLLWSGRRVPRILWAIPLAWAVVGSSAATRLGMREDYGLTAAALLVVALLASRGRWQLARRRRVGVAHVG